MATIASGLVQVHPYRACGDRYEYLILRRSEFETHGPGVWQVITGGIEPGERSIDAARRELLEETGEAAREWHALPDVAMFYYAATDQIILSPVFACRLDDGCDVVISSEHVCCEWLSRDEAMERLLYPSHRSALATIDAMLTAGGDALRPYRFDARDLTR